MTHITGKSLEEILQMNPAQTNAQIAKYHQGIMAALYVLKRLRPEVATAEAFRMFRSESRDISVCVNAAAFLNDGMDQTAVDELLGRPDVKQDEARIYRCGETETEAVSLRLRFQEQKLKDHAFLREPVASPRQ
jgi:hypothetical protein